MDKALELIKSLATTLGKTAEELWPHAVRHTALDALGAVVGAILLVIVAVVIFLYFKDLPWLWGGRKRDDGTLVDRAPSAKVFAMIFLTIALLIGAVTIGANLAAILEPTGHTVKMILRSLK